MRCAGYGLTMVAALSELAPVHVNTFQQERGDTCGIWATWNKTILDWYIELEVPVTHCETSRTRLQRPLISCCLHSGSSRLAICSTTMSPQLHLGSRIS